MFIKVYHNDIDKALKLLRTRMQKEGIMKQMRKSSFYEKPSAQRKRKKYEAKRRRNRMLRHRSV